MKNFQLSRRALVVGVGACGVLMTKQNGGLLTAAMAAPALAPTKSMSGGSNNYIAKAPMVENLGKGFLVSGTVRRAGSGDPLANVRIQIWASTERGGEREPTNRGSVLTDAKGEYRLEMSCPSSPGYSRRPEKENESWVYSAASVISFAR